ncbi:hypothetical protein EDC01DRAFT_676985 [Geopyxis carbonaria]|nr:hypothetical protein EDC01DRAFT_676985 [Geopyxis carbonaria]
MELRRIASMAVSARPLATGVRYFSAAPLRFNDAAGDNAQPPPAAPRPRSSLASLLRGGPEGAAAAAPSSMASLTNTLRQEAQAAAAAPAAPKHGGGSLFKIFRKKRDAPEYSLDYNDNTPPSALAEARLPKMGPTAGRSVPVTVDLRQAFMRLRSVISQNRVRQDFQKQRFHETAGNKRKRLRSERHRRRFKEGFKRMVNVAMQMKKMGL